MTAYLQIAPHDPLVSRDGRPFGAGQGNRMRGLPWLLPSVVAGSFRTALVKSSPERDFSGDIPQRLLQIHVAGLFPVHGGELYLPAPNDAVAEPNDAVAEPNDAGKEIKCLHHEMERQVDEQIRPNDDGKEIKSLHRVVPQPIPITDGCDWPDDLPIQPVMLPGEVSDFKPAEIPAWWPVGKYAEWLLGNPVCFDSSFLRVPIQVTRDHVCLDADRGAAAEGQIFATVGLSLTHLPRFGVDASRPFHKRFAEITLSGRITIPDSEAELTLDRLDLWHPLGGERRLVHWQSCPQTPTGWECPPDVAAALQNATNVRMVLASPAIFSGGWKPGWLNDRLEGTPPGSEVKLKLEGVTLGRWKAVSGWSLAPPRGPKPIRRMVPAGSVYFFRAANPGDAASLDAQWLKPVSDDPQEQRDGFGLATWGTW
jgi:CRISPR-associated protein Cmr3